MIAERVKECIGMMMIGDGVLGLVSPQRHVALWESGPPWWRSMMEPFVDRPTLTRCVGAALLAGGLWLACCQTASPRHDGESLSHDRPA